MAYQLATELGRFALNRYLGNNNQSTRGRRRRPPPRRRRTGMSRPGANVSSRVPTRSIMQGSFSGSIRNYYSISSNSTWYKSISVQDLIADQYAALATQFGEIRVNALRAYYTPDAPTSSAGSYAACLIDSTTKKSVTTPTYALIMSLPGSTVRKTYQSCGLHWKWTEPSDAEFRNIDDASPVCDILMATNTSTAKLSGDLIVDVSIILRSAPGAFSYNPLLRMMHLHSFSREQLTEAQHHIESLLADDEASVSDSFSELQLN